MLAVGAARDAAGLRDELLLGPTTSVDWLFIETVAKAGAFAYLDGISLHAYRADGPESVLKTWDALAALIDTYYVPAAGSGSRRPRVVSGEWGWASCADSEGRTVACTTGGGAGQAVTQEEQAARLVRQRYVNDLAGVAHSIWYDWQDDGIGNLDSEFNFGTLKHALSANGSAVPKPAYRAALASSRLLGNCAFDVRLNSSSASFALAYACPREPSHQQPGLYKSTAALPSLFVLALWDPSRYNATVHAASGQPSTVLVPPSQAGRCFGVLDMYGDAVKSLQVCAAPNGEMEIELRSEPQYLLPEGAAARMLVK